MSGVLVERSYKDWGKALLAAGGIICLLVGCRQASLPGAKTGSAPKPGSSLSVSIHVAPGHSDTVAPWEPLVLDAVLQPDDVTVVGLPTVLAKVGVVESVVMSDSNRTLRIVYRPGAGLKKITQNLTVSVIWIVRGKDNDTSLMATAYINTGDDGRYSLGYQTTPSGIVR